MGRNRAESGGTERNETESFGKFRKDPERLGTFLGRTEIRKAMRLNAFQLPSRESGLAESPTCLRLD